MTGAEIRAACRAAITASPSATDAEIAASVPCRIETVRKVRRTLNASARVGVTRRPGPVGRVAVAVRAMLDGMPPREAAAAAGLNETNAIVARTRWIDSGRMAKP